MAHSLPTDLTNRGAAGRLTHAAGAFIRALAPDPRIGPLFELWRESREQAIRAFAVAHVKQLVDAGRLHEEKRRYADRELAKTQQFLRDAVHLKDSWAPWVALSLTNVFELWRTDPPESTEGPRFGIPARWWPSDMPDRSRLPPRDGEEIAYNVTLVYRVDVKEHPASQQHPDTIHALAREYEEAKGRQTDARSRVQNGLKQGRALLDLVAKTTIRQID